MRFRLLITALLATIAFYASAQNASPYWSLAGNSNAATSSKLGTTTAIPLNLVTNNTSRIYISPSAGYVGVGTTAPTERLHVNSASGKNILRGQVGGVTKLLAASNGGLSVGTGSTPPSNGLYVSGNVGIGIAAPTKKLQVVGTSLFTSTLTVSDGGLSVKNTTGSLGNAALDANGSLYGITSQGASYGVYASSTNGTGVFGSSTNNTGVYGVGAKYGVYGSSTITTTSDGYGIYGTSTGGSNAGNSIGVYGVSTSTGFHSMGVLGVGNTYGVSGSSPNWGVYGNGGTSGVYGSSSNSAYGVYGSSSSSFSDNGSAGVYGTGYYGVEGYGVNGVFGRGSDNSNSVGVYGYGNAYAGYFTGSVIATAYVYFSSDRKLKKNIADFTSAMDIISKLQPKSYEFRQDGNYKLMNLPEGKHYGLIAQDLEQVLPNLVKDSHFDTRMAQAPTKQEPGKAPIQNAATQPSEVIDFKAVNYTELIPIVIKGMQELAAKTKEIDDLKAQVAELRQMVVDMKNGNGTVTSTSAYLEQNTPNPVNGTTTIRYHLPESTTSATLMLTNAKGQVVKTVALGSRGTGRIDVNIMGLASGAYNYSLYVDGKQADTKRLVIAH